MTRYSLTLVISATLMLVLGGCVSGPDYVRPDTPVPDDWDTPLEDGATAEPVSVVQWWHTLNDPVLVEIIARAQAGNLDLKLAEARVREARAARGIVAADLLPQVGLAGSYRVEQSPEQKFGGTGLPVSLGASAGPAGVSTNITYRGRNVTVSGSNSAAGPGASISLSPDGGDTTPDRIQDYFSAGFDAAWELDIFGGIARAVEAADASIEAENERLRNVYISLAAEVALNYIDYRTAQARLDIAQRNIESQAESARLTRVRYDAGLSSEFDAVRAEAQLATFKSQVPLFQTQRETALHRLGVLSGETPGALGDLLAEPAPLPTAPEEVPVGLPSALLQRRPDIRAAERDLAAATARIGAAIAEQFPKFALTGGLGTRTLGLTSGLLDSANQVWSLGPGIRLPIFQGGRIRANIDIQNARQEQALNNYEQTILLALEDVENGLVSFIREQDRRAFLSEALEANQRSVRLANERYNQGLEDFLSVLTVQAQVYDSEDRLLQSDAMILLDLISLYKALGGGWEPVASAQQTLP
ncbi:MAG: efflux transporter outer membrane subunit [Candidatus Hydrogenedentes bacterium]|nr:efflux transporter outer membrane subunit [Candidatus Hydrogenedentota bacterium]